MPIDYSILGQVQPVQFGTPQQWEGENLTLRQMTNRAEMQELDIEARHRQLQAEAAANREDQEIAAIFQQTDGDWEAASPRVKRVNFEKWQAIDDDERQRAIQMGQALKQDLENDRARLEAGADLLGNMGESMKDNPQAWERARQAMESIDPELFSTMPRMQDDQWLEAVIAVGQDKSTQLDQEQKALDNIEGRIDVAKGVASLLSMTKDAEEYEGRLKMFRELRVPNSVMRFFPPEFPGEAGLEDIANLSITPLDRARLEADQRRERAAAGVEKASAGREERRIGISERQADVAERRVAVSEEAAVTKATGTAGADVQGTGEAANRFRVAAAAAVEAKGEALTDEENWQVYKDVVIGADDKTLTGRKPLTSKELSDIEKWRYDELSELEAPDATWMEADEFQAAMVTYERDLTRLNKAYQTRISGGPRPPRTYVSEKKVWTMTIAQRQAVDEVLKQGGVRPTPDNVQTFLKNNPAFRQQLGLKEHKK